MANFNKEKHVKYWLRCLKTYLPSQYTSMDSNRLMLASFTVSALDFLNVLESACTPSDRASYIDWVYSLQLSTGGFRGFPGTDFAERSTLKNVVWDPANIPATYFALSILLIFKDDMQRVKRTECLRWLTEMQRSDGSFGQTLGPGGTIEGGFDPRFAYCALAIRWILGGDLACTHDNGIPDVNVPTLIACIRKLQTYDGGIADLPNNEPHGGYVFCSIAALRLARGLEQGITDMDALIHWLLLRQTQILDDLFEGSDKSIEDQPVQSQQPIDLQSDLSVGFNGRVNKIPDTCYSWWILASLDVIDHLQLIDRVAAIRYLLQDTQHPIAGGFGKFPGDLPDIYHSYLALAVLGLLKLPDIKPVHSLACLSEDVVDYLKHTIRPKYE